MSKWRIGLGCALMVPGALVALASSATKAIELINNPPPAWSTAIAATLVASMAIGCWLFLRETNNV